MIRIRTSLYRLRKHCGTCRFWEGHDFSRALKSLKMNSRFGACGSPFAFVHFFRCLFRDAVNPAKSAPALATKAGG